jgi:hypothetical protein
MSELMSTSRTEPVSVADVCGWDSAGLHESQCSDTSNNVLPRKVFSKHKAVIVWENLETIILMHKVG